MRDTLDALTRTEAVSTSVLDVLEAEARFGWDEVSPYVKPNDRCLEIGAGSCLLSAMAASRVASVTALEPLSQTFSLSEPILDAVGRQGLSNMSIERTTLYDFEPEEGFDFIWSLNTFEHLDDWRSGVLKTLSLLKAGGRAIILCPNYNIPYESHFGIPILGSTTATRRLFGRSIARFEAEHRCDGLWDSLNFIKASEVGRFARVQGIDLTFDRSATIRMFDRFATDRHLADRHAILGPLVGFVQAKGLHRIWRALPDRFHPYMAIHIDRR